MKIIHTADVHLDSRLNRHFDERRAKERRDELLITFQGMVQYGDREGVEAILIAGDLFDVARVSATARGAVLAAMLEHPWITFYYLRGNHDADAFLRDVTEKMGKLPKNLRLFGEEWTSYEQVGSDGSSVVITGAEANEKNNGGLAASLLLDQGKVNIVMLHGQEVETAGKKDAEVIPIREYKNRGIDYLALGHIHAPKLERLDARGVYAYSGCLEGRGFDECGPRGFYLLTVSGKDVRAEFVPFAKRQVWELPVELGEAGRLSGGGTDGAFGGETNGAFGGGTDSAFGGSALGSAGEAFGGSALGSGDAISAVREAAAQAGVRECDLVKAVLVGEVPMESEFDLGFIAKSLEEDFYYVKVVDRTIPKVDYDGFALDASLKGEYVRKIKAAVAEGKLSEEDAAEMIRLGIRLLAGEEKLS